MNDKLKKLAPWLVTAVLGLVLVAGGAKAAGGFSWEAVMDKVADKLASRVPDELSFGAEDGTHLTKLSVVDTLDVSSTVSISGTLNQLGSSIFTGALTSNGDTRAASLVKAGSVVTLTTSTVLTAAQICNSGVIVGAAASDAIAPFQVTLPNSTTLFADCMTTNGDRISIPYVNQSALTTTVFVAGAGGPLQASSTLQVPLGTTRILELIRTSSIGYVLEIQ